MGSPADFGTERILAASRVALLPWEADRVASKTQRVEKRRVIGEEIATQHELFATDHSLDVRGLRDPSLTRTATSEPLVRCSSVSGPVQRTRPGLVGVPLRTNFDRIDTLRGVVPRWGEPRITVANTVATAPNTG